jgi:hypothetical protein
MILRLIVYYSTVQQQNCTITGWECVDRTDEWLHERGTGTEDTGTRFERPAGPLKLPAAVTSVLCGIIWLQEHGIILLIAINSI